MYLHVPSSFALILRGCIESIRGLGGKENSLRENVQMLFGFMSQNVTRLTYNIHGQIKFYCSGLCTVSNRFIVYCFVIYRGVVNQFFDLLASFWKLLLLVVGLNGATFKTLLQFRPAKTPMVPEFCQTYTLPFGISYCFVFNQANLESVQEYNTNTTHQLLYGFCVWVIAHMRWPDSSQIHGKERPIHKYC